MTFKKQFIFQQLFYYISGTVMTTGYKKKSYTQIKVYSCY